jgi:ABC-type uncharacterized transport system YnjBCD substrate-binding protein
MKRLARIALIAAGCAATGLYPGISAAQTKPVGSAAFNLRNADFDPVKLTRENFYDVIVPLAKSEGEVSIYNFAASYPPFWKDVVIPAFTAKYGIKVEFFNVKIDAANQQMLAAKQAGKDAPTDVFFGAGGTTPALLQPGGVIGNLPLNVLLPEAASYDQKLSVISSGYDHGGTFLPIHNNQTAIGYNSDLVDAQNVPADFDALLAFAEENPGKVAMTSPLKGGSGSGFAVSVANRFMTRNCRTTYEKPSITKSEAEAWVRDSGCLESTWDYFRRLAKVSEVTNGNADTVNLIANNHVILGTVIEDNAFNAVQQKRLPEGFRQTLLAPGQIGGTDGIFLASGAKHPAAGLLLIDFALSRDMQIWKLQNMASRTARTDIDVESVVKPEDLAFLVPSAEIKEFGITRPAATITNAILAAFEEEVLAKM